jgi:hypothetical protein
MIPQKMNHKLAHLGLEHRHAPQVFARNLSRNLARKPKNSLVPHNTRPKNYIRRSDESDLRNQFIHKHRAHSDRNKLDLGARRRVILSDTRQRDLARRQFELAVTDRAGHASREQSTHYED